MTISIVQLTAADRQRLLTVDLAAFFFDPNAYPVDIVTSHYDWARTFGASREGSEELTGVYTSYDMAVTAPGPLNALNQVPMAGLSWVSVHPDHRRRGVLREMVTHHFAQLHDQGVALSGLNAAEVPIYGRFGYGISSVALWLRLIDVGAALAARGYSCACNVVLDVVDPVCPWNQRRWRLTVGPDGTATCLPTSDDPNVRLPVQALGSAYLGSRTLAAQAHQGLVTELTASSVRLLSRAMSCDRAPVGAIKF